MKKKKFNVSDWLPSEQNPQVPGEKAASAAAGSDSSDTGADIERITARIEAYHTDITSSYHDWVKIGFALAHELGEGGRSYFHRISRFYSKYAYAACDKQYDHCLKGKNQRTTIKTFFYLAQQAGVEITGAAVFNRICNKGPETEERDTGAAVFNRNSNTGPETGERDIEQDAVKNRSSHLPTLPDSIFATLPDFLQRIVEVADSKEERDILLLGSLGCLSACFPKISGTYDGKKVFANIYLFITAQASAGKGRLGFCKQLVQPIHWEAREESHRLKQIYDLEMREYNAVKLKDSNAEKPERPPEKMLFIPANSSATGVFQLLAENEDRGLIFETEGDTLSLAFKSDHGNYSDGFRKGAHHEMISYYRRTDREYREIKYPCISTVLSGTPKQVGSLIPNAENGLFSRFLFYHMNIKPVWKNVFAKRDGKPLEEHFNHLGQDFFTLYKALRTRPDMQFCLTQDQEDQFHDFFTQVQEKYLTLVGMDYMATVRRLGLIAFRISMIFTALRMMETGDFSEQQECSDTDFQAALSMVRVLVKHSSHVFSEMPEEIKPASRKNNKEQFLNQLPVRFTRSEFIEVAKNIGVSQRTAESYITTFCDKGLISREQKGFYINLTISEE